MIAKNIDSRRRAEEHLCKYSLDWTQIIINNILNFETVPLKILNHEEGAPQLRHHSQQLTSPISLVYVNDWYLNFI